MTLNKTTNELLEIIEDILTDFPKSQRGNKTASQRIRTNTVRFTKVSKEWRKYSLDAERPPPKSKRKSTTRSAAGKRAKPKRRSNS